MNWLRKLLGQPKITYHDEVIDRVTVCTDLITPDGLDIRVYGWRNDRYKFNVGDCIRLFNSVEDKENRVGGTYQIVDINLPLEPTDMYFLRCKYVGSKK